MSVFKRVSMRDLDKYVETPEPLKGIRCQLGVNGPQFYEARSDKRVSIKAKGGKE